jgi:hypothetical protein
MDPLQVDYECARRKMAASPQPDHFSLAIITAQQIWKHERLDVRTAKWFRELSREFFPSNQDSRGADGFSPDNSTV